MNGPHYFAPPLEAVVDGAVPGGTLCRCGRPALDPIHGRSGVEASPAAAAPEPRQRGEDGRWTCDRCARLGLWSPGWRWLGVLETRQGHGPIIERVLCPRCAPLEQGDEPTLDA